MRGGDEVEYFYNPPSLLKEFWLVVFGFVMAAFSVWMLSKGVDGMSSRMRSVSFLGSREMAYWIAVATGPFAVVCSVILPVARVLRRPRIEIDDRELKWFGMWGRSKRVPLVDVGRPAVVVRPNLAYDPVLIFHNKERLAALAAHGEEPELCLGSADYKINLIMIVTKGFDGEWMKDRLISSIERRLDALPPLPPVLMDAARAAEIHKRHRREVIIGSMVGGVSVVAVAAYELIPTDEMPSVTILGFALIAGVAALCVSIGLKHRSPLVKRAAWGMERLLTVVRWGVWIAPLGMIIYYTWWR